MLDTFKIYTELKESMEEIAAEKIAGVVGLLYEELQQSVTKTEFNDLKAIVKELAEAQNRLANAQEKTEKVVKQLAKQVGGLSDVMGGDLEDIAYIVLHDVLKREFGWKVGVLERTWQTWGREPEEVDIFGQAMDPKNLDKTIWIVGEAKHNISIKEVKKFTKQVERARQHLGGEIFPVVFCYRARPDVQDSIVAANIRLVFSYGKIL